MKLRIFYFSGSGNTKFLSEKILEEFKRLGVNDAKTVSIETVERNLYELKDSETLLGIGYPVYDLMPPSPIIEFVNQMEAVTASPKTFVFSTYTSNPLDSNTYLIDDLQKKGYWVAAQENFKAPGASSFLYANPQLPIVRGKSVFKTGINQQITNFVKEILEASSKTSIPIKFNRFHNLSAYISNLFFGNMFYRNLKCDSNCCCCQKCVNVCPVSNLSVEDGKLVIKDANGCLHCLRCVVTCSQKAINFTSSKRRGDYKRETLEKAYEKALIRKSDF